MAVRFLFFAVYIILLLSGLKLSAQQQMGSFMAYGPESKYLANQNFAAYQAANGYLWIGTQNGLVRFDGRRYKNYFSDYTNPNSPSDNSIVDIVEDKNGELWFCGFFQGLTRYNQQTGYFKKYSRLTKDSFSYYGVPDGLKDSNGDLWFATAGRGLAKYLYEKDSFIVFYPHANRTTDGSVRGDNYIHGICEDKEDQNIIWCATHYGLYAFDKKIKTFTYYPTGIKLSYAPDVLMKTCELDGKGYLWLGSWGEGLFCFNTHTKQFNKALYKKIAPVISHIKLVNDSTVYLACFNEGLFEMDVRNGKYKNITPPRNPSDPTNINISINAISVTRDAGIFIGGNYYIYQQHPAFTRLKKNIVFPDAGSKDSKKIYLNDCIWDASRRQYWIATFDGNGVYTLKQGTTVAAKVNVPAAKYAKPFFRQVVLDAVNKVWTTDYAGNLYCWNEFQKQFVKATSNELPLPDSMLSAVKSMRTDSAGNIWLFAKEHLVYWHLKNNTIEIFPIQWDKNFTGARKFEPALLRIDPANDVWLISFGGLFHCKRKEKKVVHIYEQGIRPDQLSLTTFQSGVFNKYNSFWITSGNDIQVLDWKTYKVKSTHTIESGLPSMTIRDLNTDSSGRIWANTMAGLAVFDPKKKAWRSFNRNDGMERDYLDVSSMVTSDNKMVIDQVNGFLMKDVNEISSSTNPPLLNITAIKINGKDYIDSLALQTNKGLVLPYHQNNITIEFAAMDWLYPFKTGYYVTIDGLSLNNKTDRVEDARINLAALAPGKYVLHIKALSGNGEFSKEIVFPIRIEPPFWRKAWFIGALALLLSTLLYGIYQYRINRLKELQNMRNNISRNLHDDIGASLSNIHILNELAKRNAGNPAKAGEYLDKAGDDIQRISEGLADIVWNINPKYDEIENLFIRMKRYAADMMDGKNIQCEFTFPAEDNSIKLNMDKRRDFYLIFKEAVNNLVKYSGTKTANIKVETDSRFLKMIVADDGRGFNETAVKTGNGLHNMRQRADSWKASLEITTAPAKGTTLILTMPL